MGELAFKTWALLFFFLITDGWLLFVGVMAISDLIQTDSSHIHPLGWGISIPICTTLVAGIWILIFGNGYKTKALETKRKDVTNFNYTRYKAWALRSFGCIVIFTVLTNFAVISYIVRFSPTDPRALSDFAILSSRTWNISALLLPAALALATGFTFINMTWEYWALVWSCSDQSIFKPPFFPERAIRFHLHK